MNEQIKLLVKQAGGIGHDDDGNELTPVLVGTSLEKFAELMVLDTIKNCRDMFMVNSVSWNLLNEKLEHFGVKE